MNNAYLFAMKVLQIPEIVWIEQIPHVLHSPHRWFSILYWCRHCQNILPKLYSYPLFDLHHRSVSDDECQWVQFIRMENFNSTPVPCVHSWQTLFYKFLTERKINGREIHMTNVIGGIVYKQPSCIGLMHKYIYFKWLEI